LFGFLPLASSGIFPLLTNFEPTVDRRSLLPIGIYGALATIGLYGYERNNVRQLRKLIERGAALERAVGIPKEGQFRDRLFRTESLARGDVTRRSTIAAAFIYIATIAAWSAVAYYGYLQARSHNPNPAPTTVRSVGSKAR
jgi:hypothetical protein